MFNFYSFFEEFCIIRGRSYTLMSDGKGRRLQQILFHTYRGTNIYLMRGKGGAKKSQNHQTSYMDDPLGKFLPRKVNGKTQIFGSFPSLETVLIKHNL